MKRWPRPITLATLALALAPGVAQAHLVATGMGPIYDGISHFGLSPEEFVPVTGAALFAGLRGPAQARAGATGLCLGWLAGGTAAFSGFVLPAMAVSALTAAIFLVVGSALAANVNCTPRICAVAAMSLGAVRGLADLAGVYPTLPHMLTLVGMTVSAAAVFALAASLTLPLKTMWMIVAARVGGSWIAALGLLLAGWIWRYGAVIR